MLQQLGLCSNQRQAQEHLFNSSAFWVANDVVNVIHPTKPGTLVMQVSPAAEYALYANGMRLSGTDNEFALPAECELTLRVVASNYEAAERKLRLPADGHERLQINLAPGAGMILEAATKQFHPTGYTSFNGKNYLLYGFLKRVREGETIPVKCGSSDYPIQVASINPPSYRLLYKGQSATMQIGQVYHPDPRPIYTFPGPITQPSPRGPVRPTLVVSSTVGIEVKPRLHAPPVTGGSAPQGPQGKPLTGAAQGSSGKRRASTPTAVPRSPASQPQGQPATNSTTKPPDTHKNAAAKR
jgi:hypothetical protein